ncbi:ribosome maturation factor RimP [Desulfotalea psychrophila]|uniref:Ribosome maturation factor RimP n=1 Tax=Desulfotalea psychrophila (strain LSv54 / DSM 12343) TaxID=177439 RepID=RIMP_DESPS|nr:ribosome maturation factor RimP [Desulfotalea psychrophila]Q6AJY2.1 RecName: Full=Ribosome maturation factor RimP [Desulfotalea psychrophila LSv54]CAG37344.1 conserved hypothetical protein [Desulfotalea psychrophila LSv54]
MSEAAVEKIEGYVASVLQSMDVELVDIQFRCEGHGWVLRLFIDVEGGVTLDLCAQVSREVGQYLDVEDVIEQAYHLEVSSPGVERPLKSLANFERFAGKKARIKLHEPLNGEKTFEGIIGPVEDGEVSLLVDGKIAVKCGIEQLNKARLVL